MNALLPNSGASGTRPDRSATNALMAREGEAVFRVDGSGWIEGVLQIPSTNCDERPDDARIELIVVHAISLPPRRFSGPGISALFCSALDPDLHPYFAGVARLAVSAHILIRRDGRVVQFVPFGRRAWHAGVSNWNGRERCNDFSVGIELEGSDDCRFDPRQYATLGGLIRCLRGAYPICGVAGHCEISPGRKTDPGPLFEWMPLASSIRDLRKI